MTNWLEEVEQDYLIHEQEEKKNITKWRKRKMKDNKVKVEVKTKSEYSSDYFTNEQIYMLPNLEEAEVFADTLIRYAETDIKINISCSFTIEKIEEANNEQGDE